MNRRKFLHNLGIGAAISAIPVTSYAVAETGGVIGPVMLERVCDGGKSQMSAEDWQNSVENRCYQGCGIRFRWYLGVPCMCPHCGRQYIYTHENVRNKLFFVNAHS